MAVKYVRKGTASEGGTARYAPPSLFGAMRRLDARRRLMLIYLGLGGLLAALLIFNASGNAYKDQPTLRGVAQVVAKEPGDVLVLEIDGLRVRSHAEASTWLAVKVGDSLTVHYQRSRNGRAIRIHQVTLP